MSRQERFIYTAKVRGGRVMTSHSDVGFGAAAVRGRSHAVDLVTSCSLIGPRQVVAHVAAREVGQVGHFLSGSLPGRWLRRSPADRTESNQRRPISGGASGWCGLPAGRWRLPVGAAEQGAAQQGQTARHPAQVESRAQLVPAGTHLSLAALEWNGHGVVENSSV